MFPFYVGHPDVDIVTFSGGVDKIPSSFGGGYAIVRNSKLKQKMEEENKKLPRQKNLGKALHPDS